MVESPRPAKSRVFVSDFDGTMTRYDFYKLVIERLLPPDTPDHWAGYREGTLTHFEALRRYFAAIRATEAEVLAVVEAMELDPKLGAAVESLHRAGWQVVVTSAGCDWYIRRLLGSIQAEVYSNPGHFEPGRGLLMQMPESSPYLSPTLGVDKARIVRQHVDAGHTVAFAGDGFPDEEAARLVPGDLRFARGDLASRLEAGNLAFRPFDAWSDIARELIELKV